MKSITTPITDDVIRDLKVGDAVNLSGIIVTGRDAAHKWMIETSSRKHARRRVMIWKCTKS